MAVKQDREALAPASLPCHFSLVLDLIPGVWTLSSIREKAPQMSPWANKSRGRVRSPDPFP